MSCIGIEQKNDKCYLARYNEDSGRFSYLTRNADTDSGRADINRFIRDDDIIMINEGSCAAYLVPLMTDRIQVLENSVYRAFQRAGVPEGREMSKFICRHLMDSEGVKLKISRKMEKEMLLELERRIDNIDRVGDMIESSDPDDVDELNAAVNALFDLEE